MKNDNNENGTSKLTKKLCTDAIKSLEKARHIKDIAFRNAFIDIQKKQLPEGTEQPLSYTSKFSNNFIKYFVN